MKPKVFVPLDYPDRDQALAMAQRLFPINPYFKVGMELFTAEGPSVVSDLDRMGAKIFLDLKFHDIPNTVAGAVRSSVRLGVGWLNIHCAGGAEMMKAAAAAADEESSRLGASSPVLLGVTVLTSLDDRAVQEIGYPRSASAQVKHFVELAQANGLHGVVCSSEEIALVKSAAGKDFITMVPGIRPEWATANDQKRIMTPARAAELGADCLVVGRPITAAKDPEAALSKVLAEL